MSMIQPALPGMDEPGTDARPHVNYVRVWRDPAVLQSAADQDRQAAEWRGAFARFVARLSPERRAELRGRLSRED